MSIEQQNEILKEQLMAVEHDKFLLSQQVAKLAAQMAAIRRGTSMPSEFSPPPEPDLLSHSEFIKQELDDYPTPQASFGAPSTSFNSPSTAPYSETSTPLSIHLGLDALRSSTSDMTQHPAAMLCDLQCQSEVARSQPSTPPMTRHEAATPSFSASPDLWTTLISAVYSQLMHPLRTIFISLRTGSALPPSMMASTPMALPLIRWLISTPADLLPHPPTISRTTTRKLPSNKQTSPTILTSSPTNTLIKTPIIRPRMLQRLLLSSPALARPLRAATARALRLKTGGMTGANNDALRGVLRGMEARRSEKAGLRSRSLARRRDRSSSRRRIRSEERRMCITTGIMENDIGR